MYLLTIRAPFGSFHIQGGMCSDWLVHCLCQPCAVLQEYHSVKTKVMSPCIIPRASMRRVQACRAVAALRLWCDGDLDPHPVQTNPPLLCPARGGLKQSISVPPTFVLDAPGVPSRHRISAIFFSSVPEAPPQPQPLLSPRAGMDSGRRPVAADGCSPRYCRL